VAFTGGGPPAGSAEDEVSAAEVGLRDIEHRHLRSRPEVEYHVAADVLRVTHHLLAARIAEILEVHAVGARAPVDDGVPAVAGLELEDVGALAALESVVAVVAVQPIIAAAAEEVVVSIPAVQVVPALAALELVLALVAVDFVVAVSAPQDIRVVAAFDVVVAVVALDLVVAAVAFDLVVAVAALDGVVAAAALDLVAGAEAVDRVRVAGADQAVWPRSALDLRNRSLSSLVGLRSADSTGTRCARADARPTSGVGIPPSREPRQPRARRRRGARLPTAP